MAQSPRLVIETSKGIVPVENIILPNDESDSYKFSELLEVVRPNCGVLSTAINVINLVEKGQETLRERAVTLSTLEDPWKPNQNLKSLLDETRNAFQNGAQGLDPQGLFYVALYANGGAFAVISFREIYNKTNPRQKEALLKKVVAWPLPARKSFADLSTKLEWPKQMTVWISA
jgi:hypothetical protein